MSPADVTGRFHATLGSVVEFGTSFSRSVASLAHVAAAGWPGRLCFPARKGSRLLILGSGPSLQRSLRETPIERMRELDLLCVNDFYKESSFALLRPGMLAIADPAYWDERCFGEYGGPLVAALGALDWKPTLFLPTRARHSRLHRALVEKSVTVSLYSMAPLRGFEWLESALFGAYLGMPRAQNVLVAAIAVGLWAGFEELAVIGADHSWHQEIDVASDNMLVTAARHSYTTSIERKPFLKPAGVWKYREGIPLERTDLFTMREILLAWATMHDSYERLARLATRRGACIFNCSEVSFIDAFERRELDDFLDGDHGTMLTEQPA